MIKNFKMFWNNDKGENYGFINDKEIKQYSISNKIGVKANVITYGAIISNLYAPDKLGISEDILLGYESIEGYTQPKNPYMNCIVGRVANRINNAEYIDGGETINVSKNYTDQHQLHGGFEGFDKKIWDVIDIEDDSITLKLISEDGEEGFPGQVECSIQYKIDDENGLHLIYKATSTKNTPLILTNHVYFNLSGGKEADILNHELSIAADEILETNHDSIPTGGFINVENTSYDLRSPQLLKTIFENREGYDHFWLLGDKKKKPALMSRLSHESSGRYIDTYTTEPGVQIYTSNGWDGLLQHTKGGVSYKSYSGICLETQMYPDSMNHPHFPSPFIGPENDFYQHTIYKLGVL
jgi:aldose 1-epimerase